ncbi:MAG: hypothetical protein ABR575_06415 [Actinomycetota bacterium]
MVAEEGGSGLRNRVSCSSCGVTAARRQGLIPLGWQQINDAGNRTLSMCPQCVRRNLWLIEARLDIDPAGEAGW